MEAADDQPLEGTAYRGTRPLGRGGMGEVWEAVHRALDKPVVVKLLHERFAGEPHIMDRMRLEAQAMAKLSSPHLIEVTDFGETATGRPFFVMPRLAGRTLAATLEERGALPVHEAVAIVRQILRGLEVAHAAGIAHRDIKPDNIFLCDPTGPTEGPLVKLLDFGIAKVVRPGEGGPAPLAIPTDDGAVLGTPRYLSPEQAKGMGVDHRTDFYSTGLVLYAMLAGQRPYDDVNDYLGLVQAHVERPVLRPSDLQPVPPAYDAIVAKAAAKSSDERYASARAFLEALDAAEAAPQQGGESAEPKRTLVMTSPADAAVADGGVADARQPHSPQHGPGQRGVPRQTEALPEGFDPNLHASPLPTPQQMGQVAVGQVAVGQVAVGRGTPSAPLQQGNAMQPSPSRQTGPAKERVSASLALGLVLLAVVAAVTLVVVIRLGITP